MSIATMSDREMSELPVQGVDDLLARLPQYWTMCIASKRNSGKSYMMTEIIKKLLKAKKVDLVLVMSNSAGLNKDYSFLPPGLIMKFSEDVLKKVWERQCATAKEKRQHVLLILDDVLSDPKAVRSEMVGRVYSQGRHASVSCCVISQVANHVLTPTMKQNSDIILWSRLNRNQLGIIWESMNGVAKKDFIRWAEIFGGVHYNFCAFDNITDANAPEDFLMVVRAAAEKKTNAKV